ncbi:MAG: metallophosphoesterase family protein [Verrucomicrobiota bacterium]|nr:metallophosphoesterase family protein [Verrucomicrobiota bacterium]
MFLFSTALGQAHVGEHPSVHDTVAGIIDRFRKTIPMQELITMDAAKAKSLLTEKELHTLATEHITFRVNTPVKVIIIREAAMGDKPFWLKDRDFAPMGFKITLQGTEVDFWMKDFPAGRIGLGVNSLTGGNTHYIAALMPLKKETKLEVTELYPGQLRVGALKDGLQPFVDRPEAMPKLPVLPGILSGLAVIRTQNESRDDAKLINLFHNTQHPALTKPDQVVLTWSGDPQTTQSIQWRTGPSVAKGEVQWVKKANYNRFQPAQPKRTKATTFRMEDANLVNDPVAHRHTATLTGLEPGTAYLYSVGDGSDNGWSALAEFTTGPGRTEPFSFIYMGDAQNGLDRWGSLVQTAHRQRPDAAFYIMAGDLVDRGNERDDWDSFFHNARGIYDRRPIVPAIGNHENQGGHPGMYLQMFDLPKNGPEGVEPERAYTFKYSNAEFFVLDTNITPESQSGWLEEALKNSTATWKFAVYHHPAYSSKPERDNPGIRDHWTPLFDKYHLDMALQGHDHAYLRTYPINDEKKAASPAEGTVYIVSVSGTKFYEQGERDYTEFGLTNVSTFQVLDIQISGNRLVYRSYDIDGKLRDNLIIEK